MLKQILTLSVLLTLLSAPIWSSSPGAHEKTLADYDLKTLAIVVNRDSSDVAVIDDPHQGFTPVLLLGNDR